MGKGGAEMGNTTTYRRPSVSIGMGLDGADYSYLTKETPDGGFFVTFNVPFKKQDVFNELLSDDCMLGSDGEGVDITTTVLKPGRDPTKVVRQRVPQYSLGMPAAVSACPPQHHTRSLPRRPRATL